MGVVAEEEVGEKEEEEEEEVEEEEEEGDDEEEYDDNGDGDGEGATVMLLPSVTPATCKHSTPPPPALPALTALPVHVRPSKAMSVLIMLPGTTTLTPPPCPAAMLLWNTLLSIHIILALTSLLVVVVLLLLLSLVLLVLAAVMETAPPLPSIVTPPGPQYPRLQVALLLLKLLRVMITLKGCCSASRVSAPPPDMPAAVLLKKRQLSTANVQSVPPHCQYTAPLLPRLLMTAMWLRVTCDDEEEEEAGDEDGGDDDDDDDDEDEEEEEDELKNSS